MGHPCDTSHKSDSCPQTPVLWCTIVPVGLSKPASVQAGSSEARAVAQTSRQPGKKWAPQAFIQLISLEPMAIVLWTHREPDATLVAHQAEHTHSRIWAACQRCPAWKSLPLKSKPGTISPGALAWSQAGPAVHREGPTQVTNLMQMQSKSLDIKGTVSWIAPQVAEMWSRLRCPSQVAVLPSPLDLLMWFLSPHPQKKRQHCWTLLSVVCLCCLTVKVCFWVCWV